jgi:hypothetical protein
MFRNANEKKEMEGGHDGIVSIKKSFSSYTKGSDGEWQLKLL